MFGYYALIALIPNLDTPKFEAAWTSYWQRGVARRLGPLAMVSILCASSVPASAQATTFDPKNWYQNMIHYGQVAAQWAKDEWKYVQKQTVEKPLTLLREASLAYRAYKQSRALYQRVAGGSVNLSIVKALPYMDIGTDLPNGQQEVITIRPVFRPQDRVKMFRGRRFHIEPLDIKNLDFDVDRNVQGNADPNAGKSDQELHEDAVNAGWQSWQMIQAQANIGDTDQDILDGPKYEIQSKLAPFYAQRTKDLQEIAEKTLEAYGENSTQYETAITAVAAWRKSVATSQSEEAKKIEGQLEALDAQARTEIEEYSTQAYEQSAANARGYQNRANIRDISLRYDSSPLNKGFSLLHFLNIATAVADIGKTLNAMGGAPADKTATGVESSEPLGQATKQVALLYHQAETTNQALKLQNREAMRAAQARMMEIANAKAEVLGNVARDHQRMATADLALKAQLELRKQTRALEIQSTLADLPDGVTPILSAEDAARVPGAATREQATVVLTRNLDRISTAAAQGFADDTATALQEGGKNISWGFIRPLAVAFDNAWKAYKGETLGLTKWTGVDNG